MMDDQKQFPDFREHLGIAIGLGCSVCGGYITVDYVENSGYQVLCGNCGHEYWITFPKEALEKAAPKLLASAVSLVGILMRTPGASEAIALGKPGHHYIRQALTAVAEATGYPPELWEKLSNQIGATIDFSAPGAETADPSSQ